MPTVRPKWVRPTVNPRGAELAEKQLTVARLLPLGVRPRLVVEAAEEDAYRAANPGCDVLVWPERYFEEYEKTPELDPHPTTGAAHNFAWDHAREEGWSHHWIMDDNIQHFWHRPNGKFTLHPPVEVFEQHEA